MIDPARLKQLVQLMVDNNLTELDLREGEAMVTIKRGGVVMPAAPAPVPVAPAPAPQPQVNNGGSSRVDLQACKLGTGRRFTTS
jgi:hypothetical protein